MMSEPSSSPESTVVIPEGLRRQLSDFRRQLWRIKILEAFIAGVIGLVVSFLVVFALDRVWQTPAIVRLAVLLGGTSSFAVFAPLWLHRWVWRHRRETQLARLISRRYPGLGDRLLGVIELQDQRGDSASMSPRLRAAAMEAVAAEAARRKLDEALPPNRHRHLAVVALVLVAVSGALFIFTPRAVRNALARWFLPLSETERYTFTVLDSPPSFLAVPYGEAFEVTLKLSKTSERHPTFAKGRFGLQPEVVCKREGDLYRFIFPGQQDSGDIVFRVGDVRHVLNVKPAQRPVVESVTAIVTYPDYLRIPEKSIDLNSGVVTAVEGSRVQVVLAMSRPLEEGRFGPSRAVAESAAADPKEGPAPAPHAPASGWLVLDGKTARTSALVVGQRSFELPLEWTDTLGLAGSGGFKVRIDGVPDAPPSTYLQGIDRQKVMLPEETIEFETLAEDDFGVRQAGIEWTGQFERPTDETPAKGEMKLADGGSEERRMARAGAFSPAAFGISPQKILLRSYSEDYFPGRGRVYSEPVVIYVLTRDEHAQLLKTRFDRSITELEDLARRELNQYEENQRLERLDGDDLQSEENRKRLETQAQAERENLERMKELTKRTEELLKDAARNGEIDKETMQKMAQSLKSMQELSEKDMPKVDDKLSDANKSSNTPEKTKEDLSEAVEEQRKVVEKMQEALEKANDANRRFEAGTFVNRLKKAASELDGIKVSLRDAADRMFGLRLKELDPSDQRLLGDAGRQHTRTASDIRWIEEDLGSFFARTQRPAFKEILDDMRNSQIDSGLEDLRAKLLVAHGSIGGDRSQEWAERLVEWAKKLEGDMEKGQPGGGGGGGGTPDTEDEDFEFMLRVMKMVQQQQDLRARTRLLEDYKRSIQSGEPATPP